MLKPILKAVFPGASWRHPVLNSVFRAMDPIDSIVRSTRSLSHLPPYSIRVRSNGVTRQFGGQNFFTLGNVLANLLKTYASLGSQSRTLEIGCGCGRTALALSTILNSGNYIGMDVEKVALASCRKNPIFLRNDFRFDYADVHNHLYNPDGTCPASVYAFPYDDGEYDVIFLVSVFTHMLTDSVKNYIREISRLLRPGGTCMVTTFLMDQGTETQRLSFPYNDNDHYYYNADVPEVAVGYYLDFYVRQFASCGMRQVHEPVWGSWRDGSHVSSSSGFSQDILFFSKEE